MSRPGAVGRKAPLSTDYADLRDPAEGARVPRCAVCGMPNHPENRLYPGLWAYIHRTATVTLCERCITRFERMDRTLTDPLTLDEVA